jgi:hypothetical protein
MANVLPFDLYLMIHRRGPEQRFLIGFEVGGLAAALGYAGFAWIAPELLRWRFQCPLSRSGTFALVGSLTGQLKPNSMFFFYFNKLGWPGSILLSIVLTLVLILAFRLISG